VFKFGFTAGALAGVVAASYIPMHLVKPAVWKGLMGLSHDKKLSLAKATALYPSASHYWRRAKDDGRAEAVLLAHFGAERLKRK
jgi:hypothetical protein